MNHRFLLCALYALTTPLIFFANDQQDARVTICNEYLAAAEQEKSAKNYDKALEYYQNAMRACPDSLIAVFNMGAVLQLQKKFEQAIPMYEKAYTIKPDCAQAYYNCGVCYTELRKYTQAENHLEKALTLHPSYEKAYEQLATLYQQCNNHLKALEVLDRMLQVNATSFPANLLYARSLMSLEKPDDALAYFEQSLHIDANNAAALFEFANALNMVNKTEDALDCYNLLSQRFPNSPEIIYNRAYTMKKLGFVEESIPLYHQALEKKPDYVQAQFGLALAYLVSGDLKHGFNFYESRWQAYNETKRVFAQPTWDGSDIAGKRILVYAEQGLGDTFQFIRYLKLLKERGAYVIFETQKPLKDILSLYPYIDELTILGQKNTIRFDVQIALMSLPLVFGTDITTVPAEIPYLHADQNLVEIWKERLHHDTNFKIGICWQGSSSYRSQALRLAVAAKSVTAATFAPLAQLNGISFYSLQKVNGEDQINNLPEGFIVHSFTDNFDESHGRFMDTAALIKNLDLVLTVDTSISHFAAALGVPTWIILPNPADWRWMLHRTDSPWYPNVRLFRQDVVGDWHSLILVVKDALHEYMTSLNR